MLSEEQERHLQRTLKAVQSVPGPELEARAMAAMGQAKPTRRSSRRLLVASAVGVLVLLGFGLARLPVSTASGLFDEMLAAASRANTMHMQAWVWGVGGEIAMEYRVSRDGFWRMDEWEDDRLFSAHLADGEFTLDYRIDPETGQGKAREAFDVLSQHGVFDEEYHQLLMLGPLYPLGAPRHNGQLELLSEGRGVNDLGESVDLVEIEWTGHDGAMMYVHQERDSFRGLIYEKDEPVIIRVEIDPSTRLPLRLQHFLQEGGELRNTFLAEYEWNAPIPEEVQTFTPPPGSVLEVDHWWERRIDEVLAQAETRHWVVTLHAIDSDMHGWIQLSLSRVETGENHIRNSAPPILVEAVGSAGERYTQHTEIGPFAGGLGVAYAVVYLEPERATPQPRSITLTVTPYPASPSEGQSVIFENIPLPPRQPVDDVRAQAIEVIEY